MRMGKMNFSSSFGFFAVVRSLLVLFSILKCISGSTTTYHCLPPLDYRNSNFMFTFAANKYRYECHRDEISFGVTSCTKLDSEGHPVEFICPDSLSLSKHYCCGVRNFQYCCDYDDHEAFSAAAVAAFIIGPIVVLLCICATVCWCCSCCCFARNHPQHIILTQPLSSTSTTMHQPMFVPQGYHPLENAYNPQPSTTQGYQPSPASMGKPPPYNN